MAKCDQIVIDMNNLSTKKTNILTTNVTSTASINCHSKKVRDCYILHTVLLAIILLLIIIAICYHYAKQKGIYKMENNEFKEVRIKNFDDIIKLDDSDLDNILIAKNYMKIF